MVTMKQFREAKGTFTLHKGKCSKTHKPQVYVSSSAYGLNNGKFMLLLRLQDRNRNSAKYTHLILPTKSTQWHLAKTCNKR